MEKRTPHCALALVKSLVEAGKVHTTHAARAGANELGLTLSDMLDADCFLQGAMTMKCPCCGAAELIHDTRDMPYVYKGEATVIAAVTGDFCPACAESVLDAAESDRVMREMREFSRQVNTAIVDPVFIMNVRRKLDLDQRQAAELFGGGVNAFSRYENGRTKPPLSLVKLLKLLDRHPDLLDEVRTV